MKPTYLLQKLAIGIVLATSAISCATATATGIIRTGEVAVANDYNALSVNSSIQVVWSDTATSATLKADEAIYDKVLFERKEGKLKIHLKGVTVIKNCGPIDVVLPASPYIRDIELSGASTFTSETPLNVQKLDIEVHGASEFTANVIASTELDIECTGASRVYAEIATPDLSVDLSGASEACLNGTAGKTEIELSGSSSLLPLNGDILTTGDTECEQSGATYAKINCTGKLKCELSGASSLRHGPAARIVSCNTSGASSVSE
ncbi:MAG: GIN domain-containing protein [Candidatus Cryptobacteroides sp.]